MDNFSGNQADSLTAPTVLYKYLSAERIESVLVGRTIRFTPIINTNDTFEVRSTFHKLAGPKMLALFSTELDNILSDQSMHDLTAQILRETGLESLLPEWTLNFANRYHGGHLKERMRAFMQAVIDESIVPNFNDPKNINNLIDRLGHRLLCLSLSERADCAPMWAHYADNHRGFIVAFNTEHEWFHRRKSGAKARLQKVSYFDGKVEEALSDPMKAFVSKLTDWSWEREWRLYIERDDPELNIVGDENEFIHLLEFPRDLVHRIIIGAKASEKTVERIKTITSTHYPQASLLRAAPNRQTHSYDEIPV